jgi:hypothetical protein
MPLSRVSSKGEKTMKHRMIVTIAFVVFSSFALLDQSLQSAEASVIQDQKDQAATDGKVLREYRGIKLGLKREAVRSTMGKQPKNQSDNSEDYELTGEDLMTVHYDNNEVKAIQLIFLDPKNAPAWDTVVGDAEVTQLEHGKTARKVVASENFWVSIYQNKDATTTRVTISKQ